MNWCGFTQDLISHSKLISLRHTDHLAVSLFSIHDCQKPAVIKIQKAIIEARRSPLYWVIFSLQVYSETSTRTKLPLVKWALGQQQKTGWLCHLCSYLQGLLLIAIGCVDHWIFNKTACLCLPQQFIATFSDICGGPQTLPDHMQESRRGLML